MGHLKDEDGKDENNRIDLVREKVSADDSKEEKMAAGKKNGNYKSLIFDTNISDKRKQSIANLMKRNFHKDTHKLIDICIFGNNDKNNKESDIGDVKIWGLYNEIKIGYFELACGLIWRNVSTKQFRMFEILFLSTSENQRHNNYGKIMFDKIERYCLQNCFNIVCVAAVPNQGIGFWSNNGFTMYCKSDEKITINKKSLPSLDSNTGASDAAKQLLMKNMIRFKDTPLYAKVLN